MRAGATVCLVSVAPSELPAGDSEAVGTAGFFGGKGIGGGSAKKARDSNLASLPI